MEPSYPAKRYKSGWIKEHESLVRKCKKSNSDFVFIGDSIVRHFHKYSDVLKRHFKDALNLGMSGDCTQHVLWRLTFGLLPLNGKYLVLHVGTNNIGSSEPMLRQ